MSEYKWDTVEELLERLVDDTTVPGCCLSVRLKGEEIFNKAFGLAELRPNPRQATVETIWDLASITKVLCTAHLYMVWANNGQINLEDSLTTWLPEAPSNVRIIDCLTHSSGYPNWRPLYSKYRRMEEQWGEPATRASFLKRAVSTPLSGTPRSSYAYSDLGFLALCVQLRKRDLENRFTSYGMSFYRPLLRTVCIGDIPMLRRQKIVSFETESLLVKFMI